MSVPLLDILLQLIWPMRNGYLSHWRTAKAHVSLCICTISQNPLHAQSIMEQNEHSGKMDIFSPIQRQHIRVVRVTHPHSAYFSSRFLYRWHYNLVPITTGSRLVSCIRDKSSEHCYIYIPCAFPEMNLKICDKVHNLMNHKFWVTVGLVNLHV